MINSYKHSFPLLLYNFNPIRIKNIKLSIPYMKNMKTQISYLLILFNSYLYNNPNNKSLFKIFLNIFLKTLAVFVEFCYYKYTVISPITDYSPNKIYSLINPFL